MHCRLVPGPINMASPAAISAHRLDIEDQDYIASADQAMLCSILHACTRCSAQLPCRLEAVQNAPPKQRPAADPGAGLQVRHGLHSDPDPGEQPGVRGHPHQPAGCQPAVLLWQLRGPHPDPHGDLPPLTPPSPCGIPATSRHHPQHQEQRTRRRRYCRYTLRSLTPACCCRHCGLPSQAGLHPMHRYCETCMD